MTKSSSIDTTVLLYDTNNTSNIHNIVPLLIVPIFFSVTMGQDELYLKTQLATLLSFDLEEVGDVFEPLLDFDYEEDLLEYMCALLGDESEEVRDFVTNIIRFQKGLSLIRKTPAPIRDVMPPTKVEPSPPVLPLAKKKVSQKSKEEQREQERKRKELKNEERRKMDEKRLQQKRMEEEERQRKLEEQMREQEQALQAFKKKQEEERASLELAKSVAKLHVGTAEKAVKTAKNPEPSKPAPPKKGKAKFVCGCFGTVYKPLTNCLHCGRIICTREGYGYCPHCGNLVEKIIDTAKSGNANMDKAIQHKERLLKFDKENTRRTKVFDDQADYFQNSTSTWLTEDEQFDAQAKEDQRRKELHTIKKHVLNIQF